MSTEHDDHGHTVAAWTAVGIGILGFLVGCIGVVLAQPPVFWIGVALLPVAGIAGKILALMGFGAK
jgi:peptidoglycan/LPS O-acetylase OafA/YrhL